MLSFAIEDPGGGGGGGGEDLKFLAPKPSGYNTWEFRTFPVGQDMSRDQYWTPENLGRLQKSN